MTKRAEVTIGRAGEFLAASIIESLGYRSVLCQQPNFDMMIIDNGEFYRCEVKTTSGLAKDRTDRYAFTTSTGSKNKKPIDPKETDIICLVALDLRKCYFIKTDKYVKISTKVGLSSMLNNDEAVQLRQVMAELKKDKKRCGKR